MNGKNSSLIASDSASVHDDVLISENAAPYIQIGQWYWVKASGRHENLDTGETIDGDYEWLGCAMEIGSNYVLIEEPSDGRSYMSERVHMSKIFETLRHESNANQIIKSNIAYFQDKAKKYLNEVTYITARLGVSNQLKLSNTRPNDASTSLAVLSGASDISEYKASLIRAEKEELPALFENIKKATKNVAKWMEAEMLPMKAQTDIMEGSIGEIKDRIFNVSLYAGLIEQIEHCRTGEPAAFHEKLRVMQRILFMDEECLLNYRTGGMEFKNIGEFDKWISESENFNRILPFPRCMVAMRVRRNPKKRDWQGSIQILMENIEHARSDKWTYLYIRNGENLYRLGSDSFEFDGTGSPVSQSADSGVGDFIFPDKATFNPSEPMMVRKEGAREFEMITVSDFELRVKERAELIANFHQWNKDHPIESFECPESERKHGKNRINYLYNQANPYYLDMERFRFRFMASEWHEFNDSYILYDDCVAQIAERIKKHNRIALLIQGLFDRSETLHPHPKVKIWEPAGFAAAVELIYDGANTLYSGQEPDIDAYLSKCNESLNIDSVVIGQEYFWMKKEAEKECARLDRDWRRSSQSYRPELFAPYGNPGPGYIAKMVSLKKRSGKAVFEWDRARLTQSKYGNSGPIRASIEVPISELFNVSAYEPGDFKQFYKDPRTRAKYLKWAPMLIAAEEYYAGN